MSPMYIQLYLPVLQAEHCADYRWWCYFNHSPPPCYNHTIMELCARYKAKNFSCI